MIRAVTLIDFDDMKQDAVAVMRRQSASFNGFVGRTPTILSRIAD